MANKPISADLDMPNTKIIEKLYKISQSKPRVVKFLIFSGGPRPIIFNSLIF